MFRKYPVTILSALILVFASTFTEESAHGDSVVDEYYYGERSRQDRRFSRDDKMISEKRDGREADDWIERGESSISESPEFRDGIRLATRAGRRGDDDYALASAIYFFDIPRNARSIKIGVHYKGESGRGDFDDDLAGRVWIKSVEEADRRGKDYLRDDDQSLHGDTFVLREGKRHEEIEIPARGHTFDGTMELHVIAEGRQTIDVKRIEVKTDKRSPDARVVTREYRERVPERWKNNVYWYFYTGPVHRYGDRHYVRYVYPRHRRVTVRRLYKNRIYRRRVGRPYFRMRWYGRPHFRRHTYRGRHPVRLRKWTPFHLEVRW